MSEMMLDTNKPSQELDPIDEFYDVLRLVWEKLTWEFDVQAQLPELKVLFNQVDRFDPCLVGELIVRNMISEITQQVHRFSPWYKLPARSFGLIAFRDAITHQQDWRLAPEAVMKWQDQIEKIAKEIEKKRSLITTIIFVDEMDVFDRNSHDTILAVCNCTPPVELLVARSFLQGREIVCNDCKAKFLPLGG